MAKQVQVIEKVQVEDDYDGKPLPGDTKPYRYTFNNNTYNLYLSEESKTAVDTFIAELTNGAELTGKKTKTTSKGGLSKADKDKRIKAYNSAHNDSRQRYTAEIEMWWDANN